MSMNGKFTTLVNEVVRRGKNIDIMWDTSHRVQVVTELMLKLASSKYPELVRGQILRSGLQGYYSMVWKEQEGSR